MKSDPWEWGWSAVEALAVSAALLAAMVAVYFEMRADRRLRDEVEEGRRQARREQASQVAIWPSGPSPLSLTPPSFPEFTGVTLGNASVLPVTNVWATLRRHHDEGAGYRQWTIEHLAALQPGSIDLPLPEDLVFLGGEPLTNLRLSFIDANGQEWDRDGTGALTERAPATAPSPPGRLLRRRRPRRRATSVPPPPP